MSTALFSPRFFKAMDMWEDWTLLQETEDRLNGIYSKLQFSKTSEASKLWLKMFNQGSPPIPTYCNVNMVLDFNEADSNEIEVINILHESLKSDCSLDESKLIGVSYSSLTTILKSLANILTEVEFGNFCKGIASWKNDLLIEEALRLIALPKLKEKNEASACTIYAIQELAVNKPDKLCQSVLVPLLNDDSFSFEDVDLLKSVLPALPSAQQDLLALTVIKKENLQEKDWLLLQALIENSSISCFPIIVKCIHKYSNKFAKSQNFGRFLVNFCKNLKSISNKEILMEAIEKHQSLLKRQALKYLESV